MYTRIVLPLTRKCPQLKAVLYFLKKQGCEGKCSATLFFGAEWASTPISFNLYYFLATISR